MLDWNTLEKVVKILSLDPEDSIRLTAEDILKTR